MEYYPSLYYTQTKISFSLKSLIKPVAASWNYFELTGSFQTTLDLVHPPGKPLHAHVFDRRLDPFVDAHLYAQ